MQSILVVGAGREGKGFLGETFSTDGWQVYFLDKDPEVVNALKTGKYNVTVYQENGTFKREITGYEVYGYDEEYSCLPAVLEAEVIALCLYVETWYAERTGKIPFSKNRSFGLLGNYRCWIQHS